MFHCEKCSQYHAVHCASHDQSMFVLIMIETVSRDSFDLSQTKHFSANVVSLLNTALPFVPAFDMSDKTAK